MLEPFWVVPALWTLAAVGVGLALPQLEQQDGGSIPLLFDGGVESARSVLSTTAGAMISVTGLVFSITIVVLQLASSQFSPRVVRTFLQDRITQHTLGVFAASFVYSLTVLRSLGESGGEESVPQVAVTLAFVLVLGAVGMFLAFIHHITQSISVTTVLHQVGDQTRVLLERSDRERRHLPSNRPNLPSFTSQHVVVSPRTGYLDTVDAGHLCRLASAHDALIEVLHPVGTFVPEGAPVALVSADGSSDAWDDDVLDGLTLPRERTMEQDLSYGFRRLVDIAERALSPGVNDPTTAVQVLDELHDLLRRMARQAPVVGVHVGQDDVPRVLTTEWTFAQYLDLAVDEIAHYGRDGLQVPARLVLLLADLAVAAVPDHQETSPRQAGRRQPVTGPTGTEAATPEA